MQRQFKLIVPESAITPGFVPTKMTGSYRILKDAEGNEVKLSMENINEAKELAFACYGTTEVMTYNALHLQIYRRNQMKDPESKKAYQEHKRKQNMKMQQEEK